MGWTMLGDRDIEAEIEAGSLKIEPFDQDSLEPASYDLRVGDKAFVSDAEEIADVSSKGLVTIDPGEFAVVQTLERVEFSAQLAGQIGLTSTLAGQGLVLLSGPQIDPGFRGVLIVRVTNLAPSRITLVHRDSILTVQIFKLSRPVEHPYSGSRQDQEGLTQADLHQLGSAESPTIGGMVKSLQSLARDVSELKGSVSRLSWSIPFIVSLGIAIIGIVVSLR